MLDRLSTRYRQHKRDPSIVDSCVLFGQVEIRDHLFIECLFSMLVWSIEMLRVGKTGLIPSVWRQLLEWGVHALKRNTVRNLTAKLAFHACVYHIWKEKNARVHNQTA